MQQLPVCKTKEQSPLTPLKIIDNSFFFFNLLAKSMMKVLRFGAEQKSLVSIIMSAYVVFETLTLFVL